MWHELKKLIVGKLGGDVDAVELARRVIVLDHLAQEAEERAETAEWKVEELEEELHAVEEQLAEVEKELNHANQEIVHLTKRLSLADSPPPPTLDSAHLPPQDAGGAL